MQKFKSYFVYTLIVLVIIILSITIKNVKMKSSLKFCVVATGEYDGYVAEPRAYEWDIAAGHAILIHSGGTVTDFDGKEILYGKKDFKNPSLILKSKNIL